MNHKTAPDNHQQQCSEQLDKFLQHKAQECHEVLRLLTPRQRLLALQEADHLWRRERLGVPTEQLAHEAQEDACSMIAQWLDATLRRLSPENRIALIWAAQDLEKQESRQQEQNNVQNDLARFRRLVEPQPDEDDPVP